MRPGPRRTCSSRPRSRSRGDSTRINHHHAERRCPVRRSSTPVPLNTWSVGGTPHRCGVPSLRHACPRAVGARSHQQRRRVESDPSSCSFLRNRGGRTTSRSTRPATFPRTCSVPSRCLGMHRRRRPPPGQASESPLHSPAAKDRLSPGLGPADRAVDRDHAVRADGVAPAVTLKAPPLRERFPVTPPRDGPNRKRPVRGTLHRGECRSLTAGRCPAPQPRAGRRPTRARRSAPLGWMLLCQNRFTASSLGGGWVFRSMSRSTSSGSILMTGGRCGRR